MGQNVSNFVAGLNTFFTGIAIVFATLGLLILMLVVLGKIMTSVSKKEAPKAEEKPAAPVVSVVQEEVAVSNDVNMQDELELVAVITAVIAASMGTTSDQLQVRSLRKVPRKVL